MTTQSIGLVNVQTLFNGFKIYVKERPKAPVVSVQLWVKTGSIHEANDIGCGLSHFLEHMVFQGTKNYPDLKIADTVKKIGGRINAYTSFGCTVFYIEAPAKSLKKAIDILADIAKNAQFPEKRFVDEKNVILCERDMYMDDPESVLFEKLWLEMFKIHPVRHPIIGYKDKIKEVTKKQMQNYYLKRYSPMRSFFIITGDVNTEIASAEVANSFNDWDIGCLDEPFIPFEVKQQCAGFSQYTFDDPLARLILGYHVPDASHKDIPAIHILVELLGFNSSNLVKNIKMNSHLASSIDSFSYIPYFCGISGIHATSSPENIEKLQDAIFNEIEDFKNTKISKSDLEKVITNETFNYLNTLKTNSSIAKIIGNSVLTYGTYEYADKYLSKISKITEEDIFEVTNKYFNKDNSNIVILQPIKKIKKTANIATKKKTTLKEKRNLSLLPTGQRLITIEDSSLPIVSFSLMFSGGRFFESVAQCGITQLLSNTILTGTEKFTENEIMNLIDDYSINISVSAGNNSFSIFVSCLKSKVDYALELIQSILSSPTFSEDKIQREKKFLIDNLQTQMLNPQNAGINKMIKLMYGKHPYGLPAYGLTETVDKLHSQSLKNFFKSKCLIANKCVVGVTGDIEHDVIQNKIQNIFSDISFKNDLKVNIQNPTFSKHNNCNVKLPREQAFVVIGQPGCANTNQDRFAITLAQNVLNGLASKLFNKIREEEGLAYYTGFSSSRGFHEGYLIFYAGTQPNTAMKTKKLLTEIRANLAETGLSKSQFIDGKKGLLFERANRKQSINTMLQTSVLSEYYGNGYLLPFESEEIYKKLTLKDVNKVLNTYLSSENTVSVIAGP